MEAPRKIHVTKTTKRPTVSSLVTEGKKDDEHKHYSSRQEQKYNLDGLYQYKVPDLTMQDLLSSIPKHCFERSTFYSSLYLLADLAQIVALAYAATWIDTLSSFVHVSTSFASEEAIQRCLRYTLWALYGIYQGFVFTGVWVIAHECGHQAFSPSKDVNNTVGWVLHSALLVPYHSWRISHARHHAGTGHMARDEVFVPRTREDRGLPPLRPDGVGKEAASQETFSEWLADTLEDVPLYNFVEIVIQQLLGWPLYLLLNVSGQMRYPKWTNRMYSISRQTFRQTLSFLTSVITVK